MRFLQTLHLSESSTQQKESILERYNKVLEENEFAVSDIQYIATKSEKQATKFLLSNGVEEVHIKAFVTAAKEWKDQLGLLPNAHIFTLHL